jgi:hypothetical protein
MARSSALVAVLVLVLGASGCGQDVIIDVDQLPEGNAIGSSGTGEFAYQEVVTKSSCPAEGPGGIALPQETDTWSTTATLAQVNGYFMMEVDPGGGRPGFMLDGGIFWYGNFRVGGTYWWREPGSYPGIKMVNLMDGRFVDGVDEIKGSTKIRIMEETETDPLDCEITVAFTGQRTGP